MSAPAEAPRWSAAGFADLVELAGELDVRTATDEPLARHTSMGVGGPTPLMLWPRRADDVRELVEWCARRGLVWRSLGGGSNLLVSDDGVDEPVLNLGELTAGDRYDEDGARFPAGMPTARALRRSVRRDLDGLVWAAGLPGTIGGAAAGNAGCWGGDMARTVTALEIVDGTGKPHLIEADRLQWGYRDLSFPGDVESPAVIVAVEVRLEPARGEDLQRRYLDLQARKRASQPVGARNSGCIFRNPGNGTAAGRLIDAAGCKGLTVGGATVSGVHANFVVNRGDPTAADVLRLVDRVQQRVLEESGERLEAEIRRW